MPIKDLFDKIPSAFISANSSSSGTESYEYMVEKIKKDKEFVPRLDFSTASNFAVYGSAEEYYKSSIERIYNFYPYDGSKKEKVQFFLSSSYIDRWLFDNKYPKSVGHIMFSYAGWGSLSSMTDGYGLPVSREFIYSRGGLHTASGMATTRLHENFNKSVKYDLSKNRTINYRMNVPDGITTEFWLKKEAFDTSKTEKEVILDLWNGELSSSSDYGRLTIALTSSAQSDGSDTFLITLQSGTVGFFEQNIGDSSVTTGSLENWHHYAFSFQSASSGVTAKLYVDGDLNESKTLGSAGINEVDGLINGYIGALQTSPSSSNGAATGVQYAGKLSASLDEFRYWKVRRTSREISNNWNRSVGSGTNTDDANTTLGVYYKFNEGVVGIDATDSVVLDYSGRIANGTWSGYSAGARSTDSAIELFDTTLTEDKDPIVYSSHPQVKSILEEMKMSGRTHDNENGNMLYNKIPAWLRDDDENNQNHLKYLTQIIASYLDKLNAQISQVKNNKFSEYYEGTIKPLTFAKRLVEEKGMNTSDILINSEVIEFFEKRNDEGTVYESDLFDIKNTIYQNIYNNLNYIFKSKGTESSLRNLLRCFGIDDELLKINRYTDGGTHYFSDKVKHTTVYKKFINHNKDAAFDGSVFQVTSSTNNLSYIYGTTSQKKERNNAITFEVNLVAPFKVPSDFNEYLPYPHYSSSIGGFHQAVSDAADYTWASSDIANLQMYIVRDQYDSKGGYFLLRNYSKSIYLTSSFFNDIFDNNQWTVAARIKPQNFPYQNVSSDTDSPNYFIEFFGAHHRGDILVDNFLVSSSVNYSVGSSYMSERKRVFVGAHITNFTGSILEHSDLQIGTCRLYFDYLEDDVLNLHNKDIKNYGSNKTFEGSALLATDLENTRIPSSELLLLNWDFETVTGSDANGEFFVEDISSGSTEQKFGWLDNILHKENKGKGFSYPTSSASFIENDFIFAAKKELPEISYTSDDIVFKDDIDSLFIEDEDVSDNFYSFEKGMYQVISEEMLNTMSSVSEMNNLIGKVVDRYRFNYKNLDYMRRIFFDKIEEDPDLDKFTEYFKWIDRSIYSFLEQLLPVGVNYSDKISDVIESHIFERNKVRGLIPNKFVDPEPDDFINGIRELTYNWKFGHAPIGQNPNRHCLWQRERAERTDIDIREALRKAIVNDNGQKAQILVKDDGTTYEASTYIHRRLSRAYKESVTMMKTIHGGTNYEIQKNRERIHNFVTVNSALTETGIPKNVVIVGAGPGQGIELQTECLDVVDPNIKEKYNIKAFIGKFSDVGTGGSFAAINDNETYSFSIKGASSIPFNIISASVKTGFNQIVDTGYKEAAYITNVHSDTTNYSNDVPMQGPFTERWVGGHQSRHIDINRFDATLIDEETGTAPVNNLQNIHTRPEANRIIIVEAGGGSDGALGVTDAQYGLTAITNHQNNGKYPDVAKKKAVFFRESRSKRPINIKNIQTTTSSYSHGNYEYNYQVIQVASGKTNNNLSFKENIETHQYLPPVISNILPATTNYHTLVGVSNHPSGNVFGVGESNILNNSVEILTPATAGSMQFQLKPVASINHASILQVTGGAANHLVEINDPNSAILHRDADLILRTGSFGLAFKGSGSAGTPYGQAHDFTYSGIGTNNNSISFWLYASGDTSNSTMIQWREGASLRHYVRFYDDVRVYYENNAGVPDYESFNTNISLDAGGWNHYVVHFNTSDLSSAVPRLWKNGVELSAQGNYTPVGGTTPSIDRIYIFVDDGMGFQDIVVWNKLLTQEDINIIYANGNWNNPSTHPSSSAIIDWYKFGYEDYWADIGYEAGDTLDEFGGSINRTISSSFGTGNNDLTIFSSHDDEFQFTLGNNPFGSAKSNATFWNELSSSLSTKFSEYTVSYVEAMSQAVFNINNNSTGVISNALVETGTDFTIISAVIGSLAVPETGYINVTTVPSSSRQDTVITNRFSAPGSIETMTHGFLDTYGEEFSVYNALPYRNLHVRGSGSGETGTIRVNDHLGNRHGLLTHLRRHSGRFGLDSVFGTISSDDYNSSPSLHKIHRNVSRKIVSGSSLENPQFKKSHDNGFVQSILPRSDFQYSWITSSLGDNYSISSGKQRVFGYTPRSGIISSSYEVLGESGFVAAITFPTASELFGE